MPKINLMQPPKDFIKGVIGKALRRNGKPPPTNMKRAGNTRQQVEALIHLGDLQAKMGFSQKGHRTLLDAKTLAENSPYIQASIIGAIGRALLQRGKLNNWQVDGENFLGAENMLTTALDLAELGDNNALKAILLNDLGNLHYVQKNFKKAEANYNEGHGIALQTKTN